MQNMPVEVCTIAHQKGVMLINVNKAKKLIDVDVRSICQFIIECTCCAYIIE